MAQRPAGELAGQAGENGILGVGPAPGDNEIDWDLINAGKQPITLVTGGSYVHHTDSFLMIRGGHLDLALLGAFEVSAEGDLANWTTDDPSFPPGVGGAMDLAVGAKEIRVLVEHTTERAGEPLAPVLALADHDLELDVLADVLRRALRIAIAAGLPMIALAAVLPVVAATPPAPGSGPRPAPVPGPTFPNRR